MSANGKTDSMAALQDLEFVRKAARTENGRPILENALKVAEEFIATAETQLAQHYAIQATIKRVFDELKGQSV